MVKLQSVQRSQQGKLTALPGPTPASTVPRFLHALGEAPEAPGREVPEAAV